MWYASLLLMNLSTRPVQASFTSPVVSLYGERQALAFGRGRREAAGEGFCILDQSLSPHPNPLPKGEEAGARSVKMPRTDKFARSEAGLRSGFRTNPMLKQTDRAALLVLSGVRRHVVVLA
jgi:hypothetical protein